MNYDRWCVAHIDWPTGEITPCTRADESPFLAPNYRHPMFTGTP